MSESPPSETNTVGAAGIRWGRGGLAAPYPLILEAPSLEDEVALQGCRVPVPHTHPGLGAWNTPPAVPGDEALLLATQRASQVSLSLFQYWTHFYIYIC